MSGLPASGLIWSGVRSRTMSTSAFSSSSRCEAGSGTWRTTTRLMVGAPRRKPGLASRLTLSLAFHETSLKAPEAAELVFSQPLPMSPFVSCASATFFSTTEATMEVIRFSTRDGAKSSVILKVSVSPLRLHEVLDVVFRPAELGQQERRRLVHEHDALQGELHVLRRHRRAGLELEVRADLEGEGLAVGRYGPRLRRRRRPACSGPRPRSAAAGRRRSCRSRCRIVRRPRPDRG